jgi:hypothetical protein
MNLATLLLILFGMFIEGMVEFIWYNWDILLYTSVLLFLVQYL